MDNNGAYPFDGSKAAEFFLKVTLVCIVAEPRNNQSFEWITANVGIFGWVVCCAIC
jgi:hypothetical protein